MIRIISNATYGMHKGNTIILKTKESSPFELDSKKEYDLVKKGIAEYVNESKNGIQTKLTLEYLQSMKLEELKTIAKEQFDIKFRFGTSKAAFIDIIMDAYRKTLENEKDVEDKHENDINDNQEDIDENNLYNEEDSDGEDSPEIEPFDPENPFAKLAKGMNDESI